MKIFAGLLQGMKIVGKQNSSTTRPTSAKVREAVMHMIQNEVQDIVFMDLFSGSGALGIEAISRGAKACYFVEKDLSAVKLLLKNIGCAKEKLMKQGYKLDFAKVVHSDVNKFIKNKKFKEPFADIIWADPPYKDASQWLEFINHLNPIVFQKAKLFIIEIPKDLAHDTQITLPNWTKVKQKDYGNTSIIFWENKGII